MSPEHTEAPRTLDRGDVVPRDGAVDPRDRVIDLQLCAQPDGTVVLHTFSDDPEDVDTFDVAELDGAQLVARLRDLWGDDRWTRAPQRIEMWAFGVGHATWR